MVSIQVHSSCKVKLKIIFYSFFADSYLSLSLSQPNLTKTHGRCSWKGHLETCGGCTTTTTNTKTHERADAHVFLFYLFIIIFYLFCFIYGWKSLYFLFICDFSRDWRFGFAFRFERWDFVVVFGLVLACGGGDWVGFNTVVGFNGFGLPWFVAVVGCDLILARGFYLCGWWWVWVCRLFIGRGKERKR